MNVNCKVRMEVTIEFPVEKYFRNCTDLLENFVYFKQPLIDVERYYWPMTWVLIWT